MMLQLLLLVEEESPEPNDVVAGWTGLFVVLAMMVAVGFLGWSLIRQLKKADKAEEQGLYGSDEESGSDGGDR